MRRLLAALRAFWCIVLGGSVLHGVGIYDGRIVTCNRFLISGSRLEGNNIRILREGDKP